MKFVYAILVILLLSLCRCNEKQVKVNACMKITKARISQDSEYIQSLIDFLSQGSDKDEASNKLISLIVLNCYNKMDFYTANDIVKSFRDIKLLPAMDAEMKAYLEVEKWHELFASGDQQLLNQEMAALQDAMQEIRSENLSFSETGSEEAEEPQAQDIHYDRNNKKDLTLFGIDITLLEQNTKYIIGFSLIFAIFGSIIYGLFWIKNMRKKKESKKDKKKIK